MKAVKNIGKIDSTVLCDYILEQHGPLSHLKVQKLLYYTEALHLAYFEASLIDDPFEAWLHGPVSRKIYDIYKDKSILHTEMSFERTDNYNPLEVMSQTITADQIDLIKEVVFEYGKLTARQLEDISHAEEPWKQARKGYGVGDRCEVVIDKEIMKTFYKSGVYGN